MLPVVRFAILRPASNARIAAAKQQASSTDTKLSKHIADAGSVVTRNGLLVISVRGRDGLGKVLFSGDSFQPVEVRFVFVCCRTSGRNSIADLGGAQTYSE